MEVHWERQFSVKTTQAYTKQLVCNAISAVSSQTKIVELNTRPKVIVTVRGVDASNSA